MKKVKTQKLAEARSLSEEPKISQTKVQRLKAMPTRSAVHFDDGILDEIALMALDNKD
jgi:hypothetical protein